ncbi:MAG: hypothetical protein WAM28_05330, partial [Chlamydiales bacterium]
LEEGLFHVGGRIESALVSDSIELLERFECRSIHNFSKWEHSDFRKKIADSRTSLKHSIRDKSLKEAEKILLEEVPFLPIAECGNSYLVADSLKGYRFDHAGCIDFSYAHFDRQ